jgi:hypothetical protein
MIKGPLITNPEALPETTPEQIKAGETPDTVVI